MEKILKIVDEECATLKLTSIDNEEILLRAEFVNHISLDIVRFLVSGLTKGSRKQSINLKEYSTTKNIKLELISNCLFINSVAVKESLIYIAKCVVTDIEANIEDWALFYYGNLHSKEEWDKKDWRAIHVKELEREVNKLKSILSAWC